MALGAFGDAIFGSDQLRVQSRHALRELLCESPNLLLRGSANDRHINVDPARTGGLGQIGNAQGLERLVHQQSRLTNASKVRAFNRVQVKMQIIWTVDVIT